MAAVFSRRSSGLRSGSVGGVSVGSPAGRPGCGRLAVQGVRRSLVFPECGASPQPAVASPGLELLCSCFSRGRACCLLLGLGVQVAWLWGPVEGPAAPYVDFRPLPDSRLLRHLPSGSVTDKVCFLLVPPLAGGWVPVCSVRLSQ